MTLDLNNLSLKQRLVRYFEKQPEVWVSSGSLQKLVGQLTTYTPSNVSRRLRELKNEGTLEVELRNNHAWYRLKQKETYEEMNRKSLELFDSIPS